MDPAAYTTHDEVCAQLDELVLEYMRLVDTHLNVKTKMTHRFQEGREQIAQAKYIMGPQNVSSNCYDHRMKALVGLTVVKDRTVTLRDIAKETQQQELEHKSQEQEQEDGSDETLAKQDGTRQRRARPSSSAEWQEAKSDATEANDSTQDEKEKKREVSRDPLRWFGVFAPAPLRNAQSSFRGVLQDLSELATIRLQLLAMEGQIRLLKQRKTELLVAI